MEESLLDNESAPSESAGEVGNNSNYSNYSNSNNNNISNLVDKISNQLDDSDERHEEEDSEDFDDSDANAADDDTMNGDDLEETIARASAFAVASAAFDERSDSIMSVDFDPDEDTALRQMSSMDVEAPLPVVSEDALIEAESIEATIVAGSPKAKLLSKGRSLSGSNHHRRSSSSSEVNASLKGSESFNDWEQGTFDAVKPSGDDSIRAARALATHHEGINNSTEGDSNSAKVECLKEEEPLPQSVEGILESCGALTFPLDRLEELWKRSEEDIVTALCEKRAGNNDYTPSDEFSYNIRRTANLPDSNVLLLHSLFATFCQPPPSLDQVTNILERESAVCKSNDSKFYGKEGSNVELPRDAIISVSTTQKAAVISLMQYHRHLVQLPRSFQLSFFRILIRLLTNETDQEYNEECLFTSKWHEGTDTVKQDVRQKQRMSLRASLTGKSLSIESSPSASNSKTAELQKKTHERIQKMRAKRESIDRDRKQKQSSIVERIGQSASSASKRPNQIYAIVRFRAAWQETSAVSVLLELLDVVRNAQQDSNYLLPPVSRLIGLLCTAGVSVDELRRMLDIAGSPVGESEDVLDRLLMIRALTTAAEGDSQSTFLVGKASPKYFFTFGKSSTGLSRTIKNLPQWPFRNDFGVAVWFRCESFDQPEHPTLVSVSSPLGAGIEVSLMPLEDDKTATVIAVTVRDAGSTEVLERAIVRNCVLLPQVWYHLAIRHTRSRMKGVFSLSARQQVSVLLDGKVMLTEPLKFPNTTSHEEQSGSSATKSFLAGLQITKLHSTTMTVQLGANFEGQAGALYLFNDNVSDATLRALYLATAGTKGGVIKKDILNDASWGSISNVGKTVVELNSVDADEVVMEKQQQGKSPRIKGSLLSVVDLGDDGDESESDGIPELSRSALSSKLFVVWDPKRTLDSVALELHSGVHVAMDPNSIQPWYVDGAKNVMASIGGIQALLPIFDSLLTGAVEKQWKKGTASDEALKALVPSLLIMLAAFLRSHDKNAREMMRCGGIDIIEQRLLQNKALSPSTDTLVGVLRSSPPLGNLLVDSLIELRLACEHYAALESTVFSRLLFNMVLWFGGSSRLPGVALYPTLMPVLSSLANVAPQKVRNTVGVRQLIELLYLYTDVGDTKEAHLEVSHEPATELFDRSQTSGLQPNTQLTVQERRHAVDVILGMVATIFRGGTTSSQLTSLLNYISYNADYEWEQGSQQSQVGSSPNLRLGTRLERHLTTIKASTLLSILLKARPTNPELVSGLDLCCGGSQGTVSWILATLVNTFDDEVRSIGIRCLADYMDILASKADTLLHHVPEVISDEGGLPSRRVGKTARKLSVTFTSVGKTLSEAIGGGQALATSTKPVSIDIVYKLLWHLLKCHRTRLAKKTHAALIYLLVEDRGYTATTETLMKELVVADNVLQTGYKLSLKHDRILIVEIESISGKRLRQTTAINMILRLLRFLPASWKEKWLLDLAMLVHTCPSNIPILVEGTDWQPSLFHVVSDTVEEISAKHGSQDEKHDTRSVEPNRKASDDKESWDEADSMLKEVRSGELLDQNMSTPEDQVRMQARFNLSLKLYSTLLGYCFRQGGEKGINAVEQAASLERVTVNGPDVFCLVLNHLLAELVANGTVQSIKPNPINAGDANWLLKESARMVTDAILAKGSSSSADASFALKQWHGLRHLAAVVSCVVAKNGVGMGDLFDQRKHPSIAVDAVSGGLYGIRLPENNVNALTAAAFMKSVDPNKPNGSEPPESHHYRRISVQLAAQTLSLLDAFIFPESLDASLPVSQLHGLALVRSNEGRLGTSQGPVLASLIRLSLVLLCNLEPSSVKFLQCCSRLRCFLHWALELIRESVALAGYSAAFHDLTAPLDRLVLGVVLHCHAALARCSAVLSQIESPMLSKHFHDEETRKKYDRRLLRVSFELREIVVTAYRGRNEVLRAALSTEAFDALQASLESKPASDDGRRRSTSKESVVREYLSSRWVASFQDCDIEGKVSASSKSLNKATEKSFQKSTASQRGALEVEQLSAESKQIVLDFNRALNGAFKIYLDDQKNWAETDLVRDLEYDGDIAVKRLATNHKNILTESSWARSERSHGAASRWEAVEKQVVELWNSQNAHWQFGKHPDCLSRRIVLVRNREFDDHQDASYELMLGLEREKAERGREERLRKKAEKEREEVLLELVKRNAAFVPYETEEGVDEEDDIGMDDSNTHVDQTMGSGEEHPIDTDDAATETSTLAPSESVVESEVEHDYHFIHKEESDIDSWARTFVWADTESVVARVDQVMVVTLRTITVGKLLLTTHGLYFNHTGETINVMTKEVDINAQNENTQEAVSSRWKLSRLQEVHGRRFMLCAQAIELFFADGVELFLNFSSGTRERDRFYAKLRNSCKVPLLWSPKSLNPRVVFKKSKLTLLWRKGKISNFEYLMHLNKMAGRTFNDVTQYPVFPWVLCDYISDTIDLKDSRVYRDLSKPVGALNEDRLASLIERYNDLESFGFAANEKFLYGSHYSSPGVVLHYLIRQEPFTSMGIELQSGRFDCPDRLFFDIAGCWTSCMTSTSDVKELVPELFTCPEVLLNTNNFPLGHTQDRRDISNVMLPPWAKGSAHEFIRIQRLALESEHVSKNLHHWIDLIFGYKQRGPEAEAAHNVFHYLSYEGAIDMEKITDEIDRKAAESHIQNFGQTPSQLIPKDSHPARYSSKERWRPLIHCDAVARRLRCHTPSKQFAPRQAKGAVVSIQVLTDTVVAVYADMSVGSYKFTSSSRGKRPFSFKMEKHRLLGRHDLSTSRSAIKRGSAAPASMEFVSNSHAVGNWSFTSTVGGSAKEVIRRKAHTTTRLKSSTDPIKEAEGNAYLLSCGYWDDTVKIHALEGSKLICSDTGGHQGPIRCLAMGSDGSLMVTGGQDATCRVWVVDHSDMALALSDGYVQTALGASNNGGNLLSVCHIMWGHSHPISCVDISSDLDVIVSGDLAGLVCIHSARLGEFIRSIQIPGSAVRQISLDSHGTFVVYMEDQGLHVYTVNAAHVCSSNAGDVLHDMQICSNGEMLVTGGDRGQAVIRRVRDLRIRSTLDISKHGPIRSISLTPDDLNPIQQFLFIGSHDGMITVVSEDPDAKDVGDEIVVFD